MDMTVLTFGGMVWLLVVVDKDMEQLVVVVEAKMTLQSQLLDMELVVPCMFAANWAELDMPVLSCWRQILVPSRVVMAAKPFQAD